jgi:hypothetical protein
MKSGKGSIVSAQVVHDPMQVYGVSTTWAVMLHIQSPTGDSSDFLQYSMPCVSHSQACSIADGYNEVLQPHLVGRFAEEYERELAEQYRNEQIRIATPLLSRKI